jgi:hypothetical protein
MRINTRRLYVSIAEALILCGLIIVGYAILVIHVTRTRSGTGALIETAQLVHLEHLRDG